MNVATENLRLVIFNVLPDKKVSIWSHAIVLVLRGFFFSSVLLDHRMDFVFAKTSEPRGRSAPTTARRAEMQRPAQGQLRGETKQLARTFHLQTESPVLRACSAPAFYRR